MKVRGMEVFYDMHCHLLPGVDDGPETMEESIQVLEEAKQQGVKKIIVTPHFHPGRYMVYAPSIYDLLGKLREECENRGIDITLYPGQECYYYSGLVEELNKGNILTLAGSRFVLVEFEPDCSYSQMQFGIRELQSNGYLPILAHFERYQCLNTQENLLGIKQKGVYMQMNIGTLMRREGLLHRLPWKNMVKQGLVDYLGSDCHGMELRPLQVDRLLEWLEDHVSEELTERMIRSNFSKIINNG